MLWEIELGSLILVLLTGLLSGGGALMAFVWRFGKRTEKYDEVADDVGQMKSTLRDVQLMLAKHVGVAETIHAEVFKRVERLERWRDAKFNGTGATHD